MAKSGVEQREKLRPKLNRKGRIETNVEGDDGRFDFWRWHEGAWRNVKRDRRLRVELGRDSENRHGSRLRGQPFGHFALDHHGQAAGGARCREKTG